MLSKFASLYTASACYLCLVTVILFSLLLWCDSDTIVNPQQTRCSLQSRLQALDLAYRRFQHTHLPIVYYLSIKQVQTVKHELSFRVIDRGILRGVVIRPKFGDQVSGILCSVDGEGFGDGQEGRSELCNGELFPRSLILAGKRKSLTSVVAKFSR
jgi:hypothetical protein